MTRQFLLISLFIVLPLFIAPAVAAQTPAQVFTRAKHLEITKGDLNGALKLYRKVAADARAPASLRARALYRQGLIHVKQGDAAGARAVFERVVRSHAKSDEGIQAKLLLKSLGAGERGLAAPRDISLIVQELLVKAAKNRKETKATMTSLLFLGDAARPVLQKALGHQDRTIHILALNALAQLGDTSIAERLLKAAGDSGFTRYAYPSYSYRKALEALCKRNDAVLGQVAAAYLASPPGKAKADYLNLLTRLNRLDRAGDYKDHLHSESSNLRSAAWSAFSKQVTSGAVPGKAFFSTLLEAWEAHPDWHASLVHYLFDPGHEVARKHADLYDRWKKTLEVAARTKSHSVLTHIANAVSSRRYGLLLGVRAALLEADDEKVRERAAKIELYRMNIKPGDVDAGAVEKYIEALLKAAQKWSVKNDQHASRLLERLVHEAVPLQAPEAYAALVDRLFSEPLKSAFFNESRSGGSDQTTRAVMRLFNQPYFRGAVFHNDRFHTISEKYLPVLMKFAGPQSPNRVRLEVLYCFWSIIDDGWKHLTDRDRKALKDMQLSLLEEVRKGGLPKYYARDFEKYILRNLKALALQKPRCLTLAEVLEHIDLSPQSKTSRAILESFSLQELRQGFLGAVENAGVLKSSILELLDYIELKGKERDAVLRKLWPRADSRARYKILELLERTPENLAFLTGIVNPDLNGRVEDKLVTRLRFHWGSREAAPALIKLLDSRNNVTRMSACTALGSLADVRAVPRLIELLAYHDGQVRKAAESALKAIKHIETNQAEWRKWFEEKTGGKAKNRTKDM